MFIQLHRGQPRFQLQVTEKPAQSGCKHKKPRWHTDWKSEAGGFRGGSRSTLGTPGSSCLPSLPPKNQLHPIPGSPLFLEMPSGAMWLFTSSKSFHRICSHLLLMAHWSKMGHSLVLNRSQARPLRLLAPGVEVKAPDLIAPPP